MKWLAALALIVTFTTTGHASISPYVCEDPAVRCVEVGHSISKDPPGLEIYRFAIPELKLFVNTPLYRMKLVYDPIAREVVVKNDRELLIVGKLAPEYNEKNWNPYTLVLDPEVSMVSAILRTGGEYFCLEPEFGFGTKVRIDVAEVKTVFTRKDQQLAFTHVTRTSGLKRAGGICFNSDKPSKIIWGNPRPGS
ncbi:MAG: hypothetical protein HY074_06505 [Deltaproteobacteria bacterium]|nr:hypothetical protein [Deltaproteobacteria bacterium]